MMEANACNAVIDRTMLGFEDHGLLTIFLYFDYGGSGQAYGGYVLDGKPTEPHGPRTPTDLSGIAIPGLLRAVGVRSWEELKGQHVRVRREKDGFGRVTHVGHFLKDQWFSFEEAFAAHERALHEHRGGEGVTGVPE